MAEITTHDRVKFLIYENPQWVGVLKSIIRVKNRAGTDKIAGSWVYRELKESNSKFLPNNFRSLVKAGIFEKIGDSTRGGHRAYYTIVDPKNLETVLKEIN